MKGGRTCAVVATALMLAVALPVGASAHAPDKRADGRHRLPDPVACSGCWHPDLNISWQWQLSGTVDTSVDVQVYDIDMFDNTAALVDRLRSDGRMVVCYISAGSLENWRPDVGSFPASVVGNKLDGWAGERWLDVGRRRVLRPLMQARVNLCKQKGFDAVEFDNVDAWSANTGFPITRTDQLRYNAMLANMAHTSGLSVGLKNDVEQVKDLLAYFDFHLDEECFQYKECDRLTPFIDAGKPVFEVEYRLDTADFCPDANALNFNSMKKKLNLGPWREPCR